LAATPASVIVRTNPAKNLKRRIGFHHCSEELTRLRCTPAIAQSQISNGPNVITIGLPNDSTTGNTLVNGTGPRSPFTSQDIGEPPAEADAGIGDENQLLGIHDLCSVMALMFERKSTNGFSGKNNPAAVRNGYLTVRIRLRRSCLLVGVIVKP
jgi:hypothetical protein